MPYTQANRLLAIDTPLGEDVLLLQGLTGSEGVSRLFTFQLELLSEAPSVAFERIIGQRVTIRIVLADGHTRAINGVVSRFAHTGMDTRFTYYRAEVVPWLWFLSRTADCRIFQNMTVPAIIEKVFQDQGFYDFQMRLGGDFVPRDYCVQYRETDLNFVARLMEQYGIFYFFEHTPTVHTLILANAPTAHRPCPSQTYARYDFSAGAVLEEDIITAWQMEKELRPGRYALNDYNFTMPSTSLAAASNSTARLGGNERFEIYDYPGEYLHKAQGDTMVRLRMEEEETSHVLVNGQSTCRAFTSGYRFDLEGHPSRMMNTAYVLVEVHHVASMGHSYRGTGVMGGEHYSNRFVCIPQAIPYRPPRTTPKPMVQGPQTAVVVGKAGEEIWTDTYGRVKVQFHWDREGQRDEKSSCWIRVAQNWAGKRWGAMFLPRIGQEVIVDFLEGDPDQPIITGRVYNAEQMPPYPLPAEQTKSTIKSLSSKGGEGFNELRFEDKKGQEQIFLHAERNQDIRVQHDTMEWIGHDRHLIVKRDHLELVEGEQHLTVRGDQNEKVEGTISIHVGADRQEKVGVKHALEAGMEIHLKAGMNVVIEAGLSITLKAGAGFLVVGPTGVTISGLPILLNSGGVAGIGSGASPEYPKQPRTADVANPGERSNTSPGVTPPAPPSPAAAAQALTLRQAAKSGVPFCEKCEMAAHTGG